MNAPVSADRREEAPVAPGFLQRRISEWRELALFLRRHWLIATLVLLLYVAAKHWLWVNVTPSLPYRLVWLDYGAQPQRGELMVYRFSGQPLPDMGYLDGVPFFKRVAGVPGDRIEVEDRVVRVAGVRVGYAKPHTRQGQRLDPIAAGVVPEGYLFGQADSDDSFDSRYAQSGLVPMTRVVGVAHVIF